MSISVARKNIMWHKPKLEGGPNGRYSGWGEFSPFPSERSDMGVCCVLKSASVNTPKTAKGLFINYVTQI